MPRVVVGRRQIARHVEAVLNPDHVLTLRVVVGRFRQRVRRVELQAARDALRRAEPEALVVRNAERIHLGDVAKRRARQD